MKKIPFVCLILALCLVFALPAPAVTSGSTSAATGDSHIFLTNPVAIVAIGDHVFIADNLEDNHSVVFCFDVSGDAPLKTAEMEFNKHIVNIAELDGKLAVIFANEIVVYPLAVIIPTENDDGGAATVSEPEDGEEGETTPPQGGEGEEITTPPEGGEGEGNEGETPNPDDGENGGDEEPTTPPDEGGETPTPPIESGDQEIITYTNTTGALDVAYGELTLINGSKVPDIASYITGNNAYFYVEDGGNKTWKPAYEPDFVNGKAVAFFNNYFYYLFGGGARRYNGTVDSNDKFNQHIWEFTPTGILTYTAGGTDKLALFDENNVYAVTDSGSGYTTATILAQGSVDGDIVDVCFAAGKLFVLNDNHRVEIFTEKDSDGTFENSDVTIGTDTIAIVPPTEFTGFTTAKSLGYPTNIIYKTTNAENSIENIVPDCKDEFVILDFEGAAELKYYYVMYGNKFGWIRKSIGATTPESDAKIQIVNNNVSTPGTTYTSHFTSLNAVYIYKLPQTDSEKITLHQSRDNPIQFTFLQKFEEVKADGTTAVWFYIEYVSPEHNVTEYGFIMDGTFGPIASKAEGEVPCKGQKINSSLFEAVKIYLTSDMTAGQEISDEGGNVIKLYSGTYVEAIETQNGATLIQVRYQGKLVRGWMPANNLIAPNRLTTNAIVGISLLSAAIALGIALVAVFVHRKKHKDGKTRKQKGNTEA